VVIVDGTQKARDGQPVNVLSREGS
jgi:hypothetical protein